MEAPAPQPQPHTGRRSYKSRRNRPCDLCRARKQACAIDKAPPCELCRAKGRTCTFLNGPALRRRPNPAVQGQEAFAGDGFRPEGQDGRAERGALLMSPGRMFDMSSFNFEFSTQDDHILAEATAGLGNSSSVFVSRQPLDAIWGPDPQASIQRESNSQHVDDVLLQRPVAGIGLPDQPAHVTNEDSEILNNIITLEQQNGRSYRFVGPCGELDTYLISRRRHNECLQSESPYTGIQYQFTRHVDPADASHRPPDIFTVGNTPRSEDLEPKLELSTLDELRIKFDSIVSDTLARDLIRLYFQFISPSFPVLSHKQVPLDGQISDVMPLSLLAAICASSIPFIIYDDALFVEEEDAPSDTDLYRIAWTALQLESHDTRLATVQASLLILQRQAREDLFGDASFNLRLSGMMVASSHTLGLNRDCTSWTVLEPWERRLRKRLWWAVFISDTWMAFGQGMPGHISLDESEVLPLSESDLDEDHLHIDRDIAESAPTQEQFTHLVSLTVILWDIKAAFFSLRAMRHISGDLQLALNTAKPLRARLINWHQSLPPALRLTPVPGFDSGPTTRMTHSNGLHGSGALRLAYLVAQLSLFRAILRPLAMAAIMAAKLSERPSFWENDAAIATVQGAVSSAKELVKFIDSLSAADWDSFWYGWSKHNFAMASTFLMHLLILTQPSQTGALGGCSPQQESPSQNIAMGYGGSPSSSGSPSSDAHHTFAEEYSGLFALARRWRRALRLAERGAGGRKGLLNATLRRTEALFREWQMGPAKRHTA